MRTKNLPSIGGSSILINVRSIFLLSCFMFLTYLPGTVWADTRWAAIIGENDVGNDLTDNFDVINTTLKAKDGDLKAQVELGRRYRFGKGVEADRTQAIQWLQKAANRKFVPAYFALCCLYENENNFNAAFYFCQKGAELGDAKCEDKLGLFYRFGHGVAHDPKKMLEWLKKAAAQGNPKAENDLAETYESGSGVPQDFEQAAKWYKLAAESGDLTAQGNYNDLPARIKIIQAKKALATPTKTPRPMKSSPTPLSTIVPTRNP